VVYPLNVGRNCLEGTYRVRFYQQVAAASAYRLYLISYPYAYLLSHVSYFLPSVLQTRIRYAETSTSFFDNYTARCAKIEFCMYFAKAVFTARITA
jgi:hypothetical protein